MSLSGSVSTNQYVHTDGWRMGLTCTWSATQDVVANKSVISWTLASNGSVGYSAYTGNVKLEINGTVVLTITSRFTMEGGGAWSRSGTLEIPHNSDGTKSFTINVSAGIWAYTSSNCTGSGTFTLDQIPRRSNLSASNGQLGTQQTLTVTRQSPNFTHTITYVCGSASGIIGTEKMSDISIPWTPQISLASQNTTGSSVSVTLTIETFSDSTLVGMNSIVIVCAIPSSIVPSVRIETSDRTSWYGKFGGYVQNKSECRVVLTADGAHGSTISGYSITCSGQTKNERTATFNLTTAGNVTVTATVKDSRGRTATETATINVLAYANPFITEINAYRSNADGIADNTGAYMAVVFSALITSLSNQNSASYSVKYRVVGAASWSTVRTDASGYSPTNITTIIAADTGSSYEAYVVATDTLGFSESSIRRVSSSYALMHMDKANNRIGLGKVAEGTDILDVGLNTKFLGKVTFDTLPEQVAPSGYGLGEGNKNVSSALEITKNGWWLTDQNTPDGLWWALHSNIVNGGVDRSIIGYKHQSSEMANIVRSNGVWGEWEWVNPPMHPGVEYRTIEKWDNRPVYTRLMHVGAMTNGLQVVCPSNNPNGCIRYAATCDGFVIPTPINKDTNYTNVIVQPHENGIQAVFYSNGTVDGRPTYIQFWYVKW